VVPRWSVCVWAEYPTTPLCLAPCRDFDMEFATSVQDDDVEDDGGLAAARAKVRVASVGGMLGLGNYCTHGCGCVDSQESTVVA
jgi:hypothetical protein